MNRHGRRYIDLEAFTSHANSLNVNALKDRDLEYYEENCLLLPAVRFHHRLPIWPPLPRGTISGRSRIMTTLIRRKPYDGYSRAM